jgi:uncharacterized protein YdeI (YjbR/CyaY-like superfamily)
MLAQDERLKETFDSLTDGKKRSLIFTIQKVKDIDKQIEKVNDLLTEQKLGRKGVSKKR